MKGDGDIHACISKIHSPCIYIAGIWGPRVLKYSGSKRSASDDKTGHREGGRISAECGALPKLANMVT